MHCPNLSGLERTHGYIENPRISLTQQERDQSPFKEMFEDLAKEKQTARMKMSPAKPPWEADPDKVLQMLDTHETGMSSLQHSIESIRDVATPKPREIEHSPDTRTPPPLSPGAQALNIPEVKVDEPEATIPPEPSIQLSEGALYPETLTTKPDAPEYSEEGFSSVHETDETEIFTPRATQQFRDLQVKESLEKQPRSRSPRASAVQYSLQSASDPSDAETKDEIPRALTPDQALQMKPSGFAQEHTSLTDYSDLGNTMHANDPMHKETRWVWWPTTNLMGCEG